MSSSDGSSEKASSTTSEVQSPTEWWICYDDPGPHGLGSINQYFTSIELTGISAERAARQLTIFSQQYGKALAAFAADTAALGVEMDKIKLPEPTPNSNKNGPRSKRQFDHRGRRRW